MPLSTCPRCEKLFNKQSGNVCPSCLPLEDDDYEKVRAGLSRHPEASAEALADLVEVDFKCIARFLEAGRLETSDVNKAVRCGRCGAPGISISKRLCEACLQKLNAELANQRSQIQLPQKKKLEIGNTGKTSEASGAVKYKRK
jgi:uncharacterized C2H2 Zn-finger protein